MPITIREGMLDYMNRNSGACHIEIQDSDDADAARRGLDGARRRILRISHPEEPDDPAASFASEITVGEAGPHFWFDMADAEAYELMPEVLAVTSACLEQAGLTQALISWPAN